MSEVSSQQTPIATWNRARGVWETTQVNLLCGHSEPWSETWPTSGMAVNGSVFELPMQMPRTTDSESLLLRSPKASEGSGGALGEAEALRRGNTVGVRDQVMDLVASQGQKVSRTEVNLMPTPNTMDHLPARTPEQKALNKGKGGYANVRETVVNDLMPTPMSRDYKGDKAPHERNGVVQTDTVERAIFHSGEITTFSTPTTMDAKATNTPEIAQKFLDDGRQTCLTYEILLGTPRTSSANGATSKQVEADAPKARIEDQVLVQNWGKFEPAIRRWEEALGRPAPAPTKPDGKEGAHRLSSAFTEWMMGLPEGWITDVGLSRNEELKACGNGVVPQQAELALRILLEGVDLN